MGFIRALVSDDGRIPQPLRSGDGLMSNFNVTAFAAETDADITMAQLGGGHLLQGVTLTSDVTYTLPLAATIAAAWDAMDIGDSYSFVVTNSQVGAFDVVIAVNTGITAIGANNTLSVPPQSSRVFTLTKTAAATFNLY